MKRIIISIIPVLCLFFAACGGGGGDEKPPQSGMSNSPEDQASLKTLETQVKTAKQSCTNQFEGSALTLAMALSQPGANTGTMQQMLPMLMSQSQGSCSNDLMNAMLTFNSMKMANGQMYSQVPANKMWFVNQMADVPRNIGSSLQAKGVNINDPQLKANLLSAGSQVVSTQVIPRLGSASAAAEAEFAKYRK